MSEFKDLYFCGDIHGNYKELIYNATKRYDLHDAAIVVLGDFGIGFDKTMPDLYKWSEEKLNDHNLTIMAVRGNHDDPAYFKNEEESSYPRLRFLEDHKVYELAGRSVYTIGGASSIDIEDRIKYNQELVAKGKDTRVWWEDEGIVEKREDLPTYVDIIISHAAPLSFLPVIERFPELPDYQYDKILAERKYLDYVAAEINFRYWFYGHYHKHFSGSYGEALYKGLDIMEFYEAPTIESRNPQGEEIEDDRDEEE